MVSAQKIKLLLITEYCSHIGGPTGLQSADLQQHIKAHCPDITLKTLTVRKPYKPGSLRPDRIANQLALFAKLPFFLLYHRISAALRGAKVMALATTLPVNFHIPTVVGCRLLRIPAALWMWDAHPGTESRLLKKKGFHRTTRFLEWVDRWSTQAFERIIVLDLAMAEDLVRRTGYPKKIEVIKPWSTYISPGRPLRVGGQTKKLRLIYAGNYGYAHDLGPLAQALGRLQKADQETVELCFVGMSDQSTSTLRAIFAGVAAKISYWPRFQHLSELTGKFSEFDLGIVSLAGDMCGICCPSKALTYISCGLPILYVGPKLTLSWELCQKGYGITLEDLMANWGRPLTALINPGHSALPDPCEESLAQMEVFIRGTVTFTRAGQGLM